jgi:simple sugar transport system ATP-binding protein
MSLELRDIHKHFGPVHANDGISLSVASGSLHGLLGENGAGKSTLMKILSGFYVADAGEILLDGRSVALGSPRAAAEAGIGMLHQDPLVFMPMSVLDNVLLASPGGVRLDRRRAREELVELRDRFGFSYSLDAPARTLTIGERQQVEIPRLLWLGTRVLILDEPTTGISADQRDLLFDTLRTLAADGMSVIFVSHKLEEVEELCGEVTVMRGGRVVGTATMPVPSAQLVRLMFSTDIQLAERSDVPLGQVALSLRSVSFQERHLHLEGISLDVVRGEVIGLAGMEGSGQHTFLRGISGLTPTSGGSIGLDGADITTRDYRARLGRGVGYLPAGRLEEGLVEGLTLTEHLVLADRGATGFFIDWRRAADVARSRIADYAIKGRPDSPAEALSGGNQQRLLLAMLPEPLRILLMEHPTRGLDIESADWVWRQLLARREQGTAIIFASADLDELLGYSDRILVFYSGRVLAERAARETDPDELGHLIGGRTGVASESRAR